MSSHGNYYNAQTSDLSSVQSAISTENEKRKAIEEAFELLDSSYSYNDDVFKPLQNSDDDDWQTKLNLRDLRRMAKRLNCYSEYQDIRRKSVLVSLLHDKIREGLNFIRNVQRFTFEEYLEMGFANFNASQRLTKKRKIGSISAEKMSHKNSSAIVYGRVIKPSLEMAVRPAIEATVHIIPSGSGVHIGKGYILTCAHCVAHDDDDDNDNSKYNDEDTIIDGDNNNDTTITTDNTFPNIKQRIGRIVELVTAHGKTFGAVCVDSCETSDLALLYMRPCDLYTHQQQEEQHQHHYNNENLGYLPIGSAGCDYDGLDIIAVGNPCDEDLELCSSNKIIPKSNGFFPFHVSKGQLEKKLSELEGHTMQLGRQIHTAWTYWGHSGCPLVAVVENGNPCIVGIHNSWDDRNGNRHAIPLNEIQSFLARTESEDSMKIEE